MCIKLKGSKVSQVSYVYLSGRKIDLVYEYKYSGMIMSNEKKDDKAIANQVRGLYS